MAVTKLLRLKESKTGLPSAHLKRNLFYICNPAKTGDGRYVGGNAGCDAAQIYETMMENKQYWNKLDQTQGFHYILSFPPDLDIAEELARQIAEEFCQKLLEDRYFYVCAVHNDQEHLHVHITFDSVSKEDGRKFHSPKGDWEKRIQPITDDLCRKYHLPTLDYDTERKGIDYGEWKHQNSKEYENGRYSWFDIIRDDLEEAISRFDTYEEMLLWLIQEGYQVCDKKYLSLKPPGRQRAVRTGRLGSGYSKEELFIRFQQKEMEGVLQERYRTYGNREEIRAIIYLKRSVNSSWKMNIFQKQFYQRWNNTFFIRKPQRRDYKRYREDILEVRRLSDSLNYLISHDMESISDVRQKQEELSRERKVLETKRKLYQKNPKEYTEQLIQVRKLLRDLNTEEKLVRSIQELYEQQQLRLQEEQQQKRSGHDDQKPGLEEQPDKKSKEKQMPDSAKEEGGMVRDGRRR